MSIITQKDIAARLGVTRVLVSRALTGHESVAERTQFLIRETAREMGYHASSNADARALAARRNGRVPRHGVLACLLGSPEERQLLPYWMQLQQGIEEAAHQAGYRLVLGGDATDWENADGVIAHGAVVINASSQIPVVTLMEAGDAAPGVTVDNFTGAQELTAHLLGMGHTRIACLMNTTGSTAVKDRVRGWKCALRRAGIAPEAAWLRELSLFGGDFLGRGRLNMENWLSDNWNALGCTALLVQNDRAAVGAMQMLQAAGLNVPRDVSLAGFDGTGEGDFCTPRLATVEVPLRRVGQTAVELLLRLINGEKVSSRILPTRLCVRESIGPPRKP